LNIFCRFILTFMISLSFLCTALFTIAGKRSKNSTLLKFAKCFHAGRNFIMLFKIPTTTSSSAQQIEAIHSVRVLLMAFTIGLHCLSITPNGFFSKVSHFHNYPSFFTEFVRDYAYFWDIHERFGFLMDLFFMMSGFLATYHILAQTKPK